MSIAAALGRSAHRRVEEPWTSVSRWREKRAEEEGGPEEKRDPGREDWSVEGGGASCDDEDCSDDKQLDLDVGGH